MKIVHRNIIGTDLERILRMQTQVHFKRLALLKPVIMWKRHSNLLKKQKFLDALRPLERYFEQLSEPKLISIQPNLPKYIDDETSLIIADIIFQLNAISGERMDITYLRNDITSKQRIRNSVEILKK